MGWFYGEGEGLIWLSSLIGVLSWGCSIEEGGIVVVGCRIADLSDFKVGESLCEVMLLVT